MKSEVVEKRIMKKLRETYGISSLIVAVCIAVFIINICTVSIDELRTLNSDKLAAFILNFFMADKGALIKAGSASYRAIYQNGQWWRILTCMYLHAGALHLAFNMIALLCIGRYLENKIGMLKFLISYHLIGMLEAVLGAYFMAQETTIGASAGIFGLTGIAMITMFRNKSTKSELYKWEWIYLLIFVIASLFLGISSFIHHFVALVLGIIIGIIVTVRKG